MGLQKRCRLVDSKQITQTNKKKNQTDEKMQAVSSSSLPTVTTIHTPSHATPAAEAPNHTKPMSVTSKDILLEAKDVAKLLPSPSKLSSHGTLATATTAAVCPQLVNLQPVSQVSWTNEEGKTQKAFVWLLDNNLGISVVRQFVPGSVSCGRVHEIVPMSRVPKSLRKDLELRKKLALEGFLQQQQQQQQAAADDKKKKSSSSGSGSKKRKQCEEETAIASDAKASKQTKPRHTLKEGVPKNFKKTDAKDEEQDFKPKKKQARRSKPKKASAPMVGENDVFHSHLSIFYHLCKPPLFLSNNVTGDDDAFDRYSSE